MGLKRAEKIHLRIQQRNKKQSVTIIENIDSTLNLNKIFATLKKEMHCGGHVVDNNIVLQGDWRNDIKLFLIKNEIANKNDIIVHGF